MNENELHLINKEWLQEAYRNFQRVTVISGIPTVISQIAQNPQNQLAIVSSKTRKEYEKYFRYRYDFARYFSVTVTADDTKKHKPDPEPILQVIQELQANPNETIYIGDMQTDLQAAHAAGIRFAGANYGAINPAALTAADFKLITPACLLTLGK